MKSIQALFILAGCLALPVAMAADAPKRGGGPVAEACKADAQKLCPDVKAGGGRVMACLKEHKDKVSDTCKAELAKAGAARKGAKS